MDRLAYSDSRSNSRLAAWMVGAISLTFVAVAQSRPVAAADSCRFISDSLKIDGVLDEVAWNYIDTLTMVRNNDPTGGMPGVVTKILTGWNRTYLYTAFIADTRNVKGTLTKHDASLYTEDVVEMFIDFDGDSKNYVELEWNCLGTVLDMTYTGVLTGANLAWSPLGALMAVQVKGTANKSSDVDTGWIVEIGLPWSALQPFSKVALPPKRGDKMAVNFYRIDHSASGEELMAWSPTGVANFHRPDKFGSLTFSESPVSNLAHQRPLIHRKFLLGFSRRGNIETIFSAIGQRFSSLDK